MSARVAVRGGTLFARVDEGDAPGGGGAPREADAPWIVLSNSLAADHSMWDPQIPFLTGRYRVLRYDTRGHGRSDAPPGPYDLGMLVEDVVTLMDRFGIARAAYLGLSLGGMTGLGLALAHPDRLTRLICCDARADAPEPFRRSWDERMAVVDREGMRGILQGTMERWLAPDFRAASPETVSRVQAMILGTSVEGYKGCAEALKRLDYLGALGSLQLPTLYVVGSEDQGAPPDVMRRMAEATPGARLAVVPGGAHLPNLDRRAAFNAAIAGFLELPQE